MYHVLVDIGMCLLNTRLIKPRYLADISVNIFNNIFLKVSLATFVVYVYTGNELTASKAFVALSLFNLLSFPVTMLPNIITSTIQVLEYANLM